MEEVTEPGSLSIKNGRLNLPSQMCYSGCSIINWYELVFT